MITNKIGNEVFQTPFSNLKNRIFLKYHQARRSNTWLIIFD